jgi:hypothetical protein
MIRYATSLTPPIAACVRDDLKIKGNTYLDPFVKMVQAKACLSQVLWLRSLTSAALRSPMNRLWSPVSMMQTGKWGVSMPAFAVSGTLLFLPQRRHTSGLLDSDARGHVVSVWLENQEALVFCTSAGRR